MSRHQRPKASRLEADLELSVICGQLADGQSPAMVAARSQNPRAVAVLANALALEKRKSPEWLEEENNFLRINLGWLSDEEMGRRLGRSAIGVHIRWKRDLKLTAPSRHPDWITAEQIAQGLGMDGHAVASWIDRGLLPGRRLPLKDVTRVVYRTTFLRWALNPENWVYFKLERVGRGTNHRIKKIYAAAFWKKVRRLIKCQCARWNDEWWNTNQVAHYHHVNNKDVLRYITLGRLKAVRVANYAGRHPQAYWAHWYVLKSEATRPDLIFQRGKGSGHELAWSDAGDAFIVLARAIGLSYGAIGRMMGNWAEKRVDYRLRQLRRSGRIPRLIKKYDLKVQYCSRTGALLADWKEYRQRFKSVARLMGRFKSKSGAWNKHDLDCIRGVLQAWAKWHAKTPGQRKVVGTLSVAGRLREQTLRRAYQELRSWNVDPLKHRSR